MALLLRLKLAKSCRRCIPVLSKRLLPCPPANASPPWNMPASTPKPASSPKNSVVENQFFQYFRTKAASWRLFYSSFLFRSAILQLTADQSFFTSCHVKSRDACAPIPAPSLKSPVFRAFSVLARFVQTTGDRRN